MGDEPEHNSVTIGNLPHQEAGILEKVLAASFEEAPVTISRYLEQLSPSLIGSRLELFLKSLWHHFEGIRIARAEGKFDLAKNLQETAAAGFQELRIAEMEASSRALASYAAAIIELQQSNVNRCHQLFKETEEYLRSAGRFGKQFHPLIDHMKPEAFFVAAVIAINAGDMVSARALITKASTMSEKVATTYYANDPRFSSTFFGLAYFYKAFFDFNEAQRDLNKLELDKLETNDIAKNAIEAERLLAQADLQNLQVYNTHHFAKALIDLSSVIRGLSIRMHHCFKATFKPNLHGFEELQSRTHQAIENISRAGPHAMPMLRFCEELLGRIKNLERLARPRKSDFGIYSGLVSAVLFSTLLVSGLWARHQFGFELDNRMFFIVIVGLSLIGGFGFGALRFKDFFLSAFKTK